MQKGKFDPEETLDAVWCYDSETGHRMLLDKRTGQVIAIQECDCGQQRT